MSDGFIKMISNIDFSYGFIYDRLAIKLYSNFEYNEHVKNNKFINSNCSYLINICSDKYFELSKDEYSKIKIFLDNNIDTFESILTPIHNFIDLYKKFYDNYCYAYVVVIVKKIIMNVFVLLINIVNFVKKIILF